MQVGQSHGLRVAAEDMDWLMGVACGTEEAADVQNHHMEGVDHTHLLMAVPAVVLADNIQLGGENLEDRIFETGVPLKGSYC